MISIIMFNVYVCLLKWPTDLVQTSILNFIHATAIIFSSETTLLEYIWNERKEPWHAFEAR